MQATAPSPVLVRETHHVLLRRRGLLAAWPWELQVRRNPASESLTCTCSWFCATESRLSSSKSRLTPRKLLQRAACTKPLVSASPGVQWQAKLGAGAIRGNSVRSGLQLRPLQGNPVGLAQRGRCGRKTSPTCSSSQGHGERLVRCLALLSDTCRRRAELLVIFCCGFDQKRAVAAGPATPWFFGAALAGTAPAARPTAAPPAGPNQWPWHHTSTSPMRSQIGPEGMPR